METRNLRKERVGVVVSNKMDKTIVVAVKWKEKHPIYGKTFCEVYPLASFGKLKGVGFFDKDFTGKYFIVLDEFQLEQGEKRTSFDILYNFIGMLENIARTTKNNIEVWLLGNTLEEASTIFKALDFIPEKFGRYYLKRKKCVIDYLEPTEEYLKDRKGSLADILGGGDMSNYTNEIKKDVKLITKQRVNKPTFIIKFSKSANDWFVCWDSKVIKRYSGQTCDNIISMKPYIDEFFNKEKKQSILDMYDGQYFLYDTLITKTYFEDNLKKIRTTK